MPLEIAGGRSTSKHTVMRENIATSIAQGDLCCVKSRVSEHEIHEQSIHEQDLSVLAKVGNVSRRLNFLDASIQNKCVDKRMFVSSLMKATIHLGLNCLANLEIYKITKFEEIESLFNITQMLGMEHSEEILNVKWLEYSSPSWTRSVFSHDQTISWPKAKV